jgi:NitT/TauT family transport system substrate-binding protein
MGFSIVRFVLAIFSAAAVSAACAQPRPEMPKIIVSQSGAGDPTFYTPYYVAQAKGFFREQGLEVSADGVPGIQELAVVLSGQAQFTAVTSFSILSASKGRYLTTVAGVIYQYGVDLVLSNAVITKLRVSRTDPIAKRIEALRGLKIGISAIGSGMDTFARYVLPRYGVQPDKDVTLVTLGSCTAMLAALQSGNIDGYLCGPPGPQEAEAKGLGKVILSATAGEVPDVRGVLYSGYFARPDFIQQNPNTVQAFVNAIAKALKYIQQNPAEAAAITHQVNPSYDSAVSATTFEAYLKAFADTPVIPVDSMIRAIEVMKTTTPSVAQVDANKLIDNSFARRAAALVR